MAGKFEYKRPGEQLAYAEGRAKAFGIGPANPHPTTSLKYAAWQAGNTFTGSRDSTVYGAAGWSTTWTPVTFGGSAQLDNPSNVGMAATFDTMTVAVAFRVTSLAGATVLIGHTSTASLGLITVATDGSVALNSPSNLATAGILGATLAPAASIVTGVDYVLHVALRASTNTLSAWLNGTALSPTGSWLGTGAMPRPSAWSVGGGTDGLLRLTGRMGLAWVGDGQFITTSSSFSPAYDLGATLNGPGAQPRIGFGNLQTVANWNAGTNQGNGTGTWTMTGAVT